MYFATRAVTNYSLVMPKKFYTGHWHATAVLW